MKPDRLHTLLEDSGIPPPVIPGMVADSRAGYELWVRAISPVLSEAPFPWDAMTPEQQFSIVLLCASIQEVVLGRLQLQVAPVATTTVQ